MSTKTLRKRIALVAVSAMGFGLLSVVPVAADDKSAASIASVTVPLTRVGDTQVVKVKLNYGTTDTYTAGSDSPTAGSYVRARLLSGPTSGSLGATVISSADLNTFANETVTSTTATITPTFSITPTVAGTYTMLVWVDESNTSDNALVPAVTDRQTTVTFTTAGALQQLTLLQLQSQVRQDLLLQFHSDLL